jgi:DNA-binding NarL/FixJ family response regulator
VPSREPPGARESAAPRTSTGLTARERKVLELLAKGLTSRRIAKTLFITEKTVSVHVTHILAKLQVTSGRRHALSAARGEQSLPPIRVSRWAGGGSLASQETLNRQWRR